MLDLKKLLQFKVNYLSNSVRSDIDLSTKEGQSTYLKRVENLIELEKEAETLFYEIPNLEFELFNIFQPIKEKAYENAVEQHKSHLKKIKSTYSKKYFERKVEEYEIYYFEMRPLIESYFEFFNKAYVAYENKNRKEFNSLLNNGVTLYLGHINTFANRIIKICDFRSEVEEYLMLDNICKIINGESESIEKIDLIDLIREEKKDLFFNRIDILRKRKVIEKSFENKYIWRGKLKFKASDSDLTHDKYAGLSDKKLLIAFGFLLHQEGFFYEKTLYKSLSKGLSIFFNHELNSYYFSQERKNFNQMINSGEENIYLIFFEQLFNTSNIS